jgi:hypothetical protein
MAVQIGQAVSTAVAASQEQLTKDSTFLAEEIARKKHFLQIFRRWEMLFKRADKGDVQAEKWLIADYFKSLGHLSPDGLELLTDELKKVCTFFPSVKECLEITNPKQYDYGSPFYRLRHLQTDQHLLAAPEKRNERLLGQIQAERKLTYKEDYKND